MDGTRFELNGLLVVIKGVVLNVKRCGWRGRPAGLWLKGINLAKAKKEDLEQHDRSTAHQKIAMTQREEDNRVRRGNSQVTKISKANEINKHLTNSAKSKKKEEAQFCTILHHTKKPQKIRLLPANIN